MLAVSFGEAIWLIIVSFLFIAYLMMLFSVIVDLFRDRELSGVLKAVWAIALILFPFITLLAYLIVRGKGMAERSIAQQQAAQQQVDSYIRDVAGGGAASELKHAAELKESGAINSEEYEALKAKILAS